MLFVEYTLVSTSWWTQQVARAVKNLPANAGDITDAGLISGSGRKPGGRNGNLLQYSCLLNPMDRGAWRAIVHRVAKSWTWLKRFSTCSLKIYIQKNKTTQTTNQKTYIHLNPALPPEEITVIFGKDLTLWKLIIFNYFITIEILEIPQLLQNSGSSRYIRVALDWKFI